MRCPNCEQINEDSNSFCMYCGIPLQVETQGSPATFADEEISLTQLSD